MRLGVVGSGAWGTALAQVAAQKETVLLWAREPEVVAGINDARENSLFLPGVPLASSIEATGELSVLNACNALLIVTPAQFVRTTLAQLPAVPLLVLCAKGIEAGSHALISEVAHEVLPDAEIAVLSGPTFAAEVARGLPTAVTLACADARARHALAERLRLPAFRLYGSDDVTGAEIGGAVKNVLAIACGVVEGQGLGQNARAALIARGFAEMTRYGLARGGRADTLAGLSGLGDLVLTCSSTQSRNFSLGLGLGQGRHAVELLGDRRTVAEGAFTAPVLRDSARALGIEMPVVEAVAALLDGSMDAGGAIKALLARPLRDEA